jgi:APA family basic amino acid/polyamine antiporter
MSEAPKEGLLKSFGLKMAIFIVMSAIIGSGVFKKVAPMSEGLHAPWLVVLAWALAGLIVLFGALSIAELGAMFPDSGGPFSWLEKIYGKIISYLYGWTCFSIIQTASIASIAFVFSGALNTFIALPHLPAEWESITLLGIIQPFDNIGAKFVSILLIILLTYINIRGAKKGGFISTVLSIMIGVAIIIISLIALNSSMGSWQTFETKSITYPSEGFTFLGFLGAMVIAMRSAFWGYEGWISLGFIGEELQNPHKTLPRAMIFGILAVMMLYVLINSSYLYVMPIDEMVQATKSDSNSIAAVLVIDKIFGSNGAYIVSGMILISTLSCTNATILVSSRIYYAMAQKGLFFKGAAKQHPKNRTPSNSLIYQAIWASVLVFSGSFDFLTDLVVTAAFLFYGLIVFGVIVLRKKDKTTPRPYRAIGYPVIPIIFTVFCLILLVISFMESPVQSVIGIVLIFAGLPLFYYWKNKHKV